MVFNNLVHETNIQKYSITNVAIDSKGFFLHVDQFPIKCQSLYNISRYHYQSFGSKKRLKFTIKYTVYVLTGPCRTLI